MPSSWWRLWGCLAHKEWRIQVLAFQLQRVMLCRQQSSGGCAAGWVTRADHGQRLCKEVQSTSYISKHEPCSALPSPSMSRRIFFWWQTNHCKIAAGSAPHSPQSIAVHWFIYFLHCGLFSSVNVVDHSITLELKSKISEANSSGLLTQVARSHEQKNDTIANSELSTLGDLFLKIRSCLTAKAGRWTYMVQQGFSWVY